VVPHITIYTYKHVSYLSELALDVLGVNSMADFKIVVSDPEAAKTAQPIKVKIVGVDLPYDNEIKEGFKLPTVKINKSLHDKIKPKYGIVTLRIYKPEANEKVNIRAKVEVDDNVPDGEAHISAALLVDKIGSNEAEGEIFRAKAWQIRINDERTKSLIGLKIGDVFDGSIIGLKGVKLKITGGSDYSGFPMRPDIHGGVKKRVLLSGPPGFHPREKGERRRKTIRGNTITEDIVQINTAIVY